MVREVPCLARAYLAITKWQLGEVGPARALIEEAVAHAIETGHVPTLVLAYLHKAHLFAVMLERPGAPRKLPSNSAKRMRLRSMELGQPCKSTNSRDLRKRYNKFHAVRASSEACHTSAGARAVGEQSWLLVLIQFGKACPKYPAAVPERRRRPYCRSDQRPCRRPVP